MLSTMRMGVASLEHNNKHHARVPNGGRAVVFGARVRPIFSTGGQGNLAKVAETRSSDPVVADR